LWLIVLQKGATLGKNRFPSQLATLMKWQEGRIRVSIPTTTSEPSSLSSSMPVEPVRNVAERQSTTTDLQGDEVTHPFSIQARVEDNLTESEEEEESFIPAKKPKLTITEPYSPTKPGYNPTLRSFLTNQTKPMANLFHTSPGDQNSDKQPSQGSTRVELSGTKTEQTRNQGRNYQNEKNRSRSRSPRGPVESGWKDHVHPTKGGEPEQWYTVEGRRAIQVGRPDIQQRYRTGAPNNSGLQYRPADRNSRDQFSSTTSNFYQPSRGFRPRGHSPQPRNQYGPWYHHNQW